MATISVLMTGMGSAILLASRALPAQGNSLDEVVRTAGTIDQLNSELQYATRITAQSSTSLTFTVFRDGADRQIIYDWQGDDGDPLTRKYASLTTVDLLDSVQDFAMTYDTAVLGTVREPDVEGPEAELMSWVVAANLIEFEVARNQWVGQYFKPTLPADAASWKVTRVKLNISRGGPADGITSLQLRTAAGGNLPSDTILHQTAVVEATLPNQNQWVEFVIGDVSGLAPNTGLCLVLAHVIGALALEVEYQAGGVTLPNSGMLEYDGVSWTFAATNALNFYIYGTVTTAGAVQPGPESLLAVQVALQTGADSSTRIEHNIPLLNQPAMP